MALADHIRVKRAQGMYYHHGIDMADGTVIHFSGEPLQQTSACVCRVPLDDFLKGGIKELVTYHEDVALLSAEETVRLAQERLGKKGYSLFRNNCEHFATYCKTGEPYSRQVRKYLNIAGILIVTSASIAGATIGAKLLGTSSRRG